ncbi:N-acetylmuramoyl-L-alanine amidase [Tissierella sp. MSJ-40]|uniref:N-acetylmuramoyl-L-alanine amidase n=1 Tax=Tissierella simiarum TaxID=2841534 RepID=A0ABS6E2B4_9FIRM|nr:N-acetylmuramoyl-L-alanine amidase [Tissierella simiarum]MBU5437023.1 N-acetylmuramoyl-L-alanine amidase [Tissierella simiarum]
MENYFHIKYYDQEAKQIYQMPLEEMVKALLPSQIDIDFHIEALKTQAVIIRTNLLKNYLNHKDNDIDLKDCVKDLYEGNDEYIDKINRAIEETKGIVIVYEDKPIFAEYHDTCGGSTENSENVLDNNIVYLRRVLCGHCTESPFWRDEKIYSTEEIEELLNVKFPKNIIGDDPKITGYIENIEKDGQERIISLDISGKNMSGKELMEKLNLNSTRFDITPTSIKFITRGKGHGLGLCQRGAEEMAQKGYKFKEILKYYYTGVEVLEYKLPSINKPLLGIIIVIDPGHGGKDIGYVGKEGLMEKDIVYTISVALKERLEGLGALVHLTRGEDENILITKRAEITNEIRPNFFISLHMDYYPNSTMKGCELYYFRKDEESKKLGKNILEALEEKGIPTRGVKEGNFYIFRGINVSSLLMEIGYLSNIEEEKRFKDEKYISELVEGICKGILQYFEY